MPVWFQMLIVGIVAAWLSTAWTQHMTLHEPFADCLVSLKIYTCH